MHHTGEHDVRGTDLAGPALNCCWRLRGHLLQEQAQGRSDPAGHPADPAELLVQQQLVHLALR